MTELFYKLDLQHFAEGAAPAGGEASTGAEAAPAEGQPEVQEVNDAQRRADFEKLVKEDYKDLYDERAQQMINKRFKEVKGLEARSETLSKLEPALDMLYHKYGVEDIDQLVQSIEDDDSYWEQLAYDRNLTVEQVKYMTKIERENEAFKRTEAQKERQRLADEQVMRWHQQADEMKQSGKYPNFDLEAECRGEHGEDFIRLLASNAGLGVEDAYFLVHKDDIISGAMQLTAQTVRDKTINDIRARGARPAEAGARPQAATVMQKKNPADMTKAEREELARRSLAGERITW